MPQLQTFPVRKGVLQHPAPVWEAAKQLMCCPYKAAVYVKGKKTWHKAFKWN